MMSANLDLVGRMKHLLSSGDKADVHISVGEGDEKEHFSAHKLILSTASEVFDEMFRMDSENGKVEDDANWEVISSLEVTDVEVGAFKVMLDFIYTNNLSGMNGKNFLAVLYAAKKYRVTKLINMCEGFSILKLANVFLAFTYTRTLGLNNFSLRCLAYIARNADTLIQTKRFLKIDQDLLAELFDNDQLRICGEIALWKAALFWADEKCRQKGSDCSGENRRAVLGPALLKIRFTRIPKEEFVSSIVPSGVLTTDEMLSVFIYHENAARLGLLEQFPPLPFATQRRIYICKETITWKIENLSEFVKDKPNNYRSNDAKIIGGIPWEIKIAIFSRGFVSVKFHDKEKQSSMLDFYCSTSFRIVSQKEEKKDFVRRDIANGRFEIRCTPASIGLISIKELMDPDNGWYDEKDDSVTLVIELFVDEQQQQKEGE